MALRQQQATRELFAISEVDAEYQPGEFLVRNAVKHNEYKVVYRGKDSLWNYCSCFDFKTAQLGTCKHLETVKNWVKKKRKKIAREEPAYSSVYIDYRGPRKVKIRIGENSRERMESLAHEYFDENNTIRDDAYTRFDAFVHAATQIDADFRCYDDAMEYIIEKREKAMRERMMTEKYSDKVLDEMLTVSLYPYQKEGIRFAIGAGKAIIADEMGLGKTIQAIAAAEIYQREGLAESVLIVCPTSLKYQWKKEIEKFTGEKYIETTDANGEYIQVPKVIVVEGTPSVRKRIYRSLSPYKIVSYHSMCNDVREIGKLIDRRPRDGRDTTPEELGHAHLACCPQDRVALCCTAVRNATRKQT